MIYRTRQRKYRAVKKTNPNQLDTDVSQVAPMSLNPLIRGLRLFGVLAFAAFDIGMSIYQVSK